MHTVDAKTPAQKNHHIFDMGFVCAGGSVCAGHLCPAPGWLG